MQHGYTVLPDRPLPLAAGEVEAAVREDLARCRLSIHMVGRTYSWCPRARCCRSSSCRTSSRSSAPRKGQFSRLIWIPPGLQVDDDRQRKVLDALRMDPRMGKEADLLETPLEDLRTVIRRLADENRGAGATAAGRTPPDTPAAPVSHLRPARRRRDRARGPTWLFTDFEVIHPAFDGSDSEMPRYHDENLRSCQGALIFYGSAGEPWLRGKLRELQKCAAFRETRTRPRDRRLPDRAAHACQGALPHPQAMLIPQWDGLAPERCSRSSLA